MSIWKRWLSKASEPPPAPVKSSARATPNASATPRTPDPDTPMATPLAVTLPGTNPDTVGRKIAYDPNLIEGFKRDHAELVRLFTGVVTSHGARVYPETALGLQRFKTALQAHVLAENVRFYAYLQNTLINDASDAQLMHEFRREMNAIVRGVTDFLKKYDSPATLNADTHDAFSEEISEIGALLLQRIEREERSLYPMYQ